MKQLRQLSLIEWITLIGIAAISGALLLPDSSLATRRQIEQRVREFDRKSAAKLTDGSIIATQADIKGTWLCRHLMNRSSFTFSQRADGKFDLEFSTSGCFGGHNLRRVASLDNGVIQLDTAVAEYLPRTYDTLYVVRIGETQYLLPAEGLIDFERELTSGSEDWQWHVFRRRSDTLDPT